MHYTRKKVVAVSHTPHVALIVCSSVRRLIAQTSQHDIGHCLAATAHCRPLASPQPRLLNNLQLRSLFSSKFSSFHAISKTQIHCTYFTKTPSKATLSLFGRHHNKTAVVSPKYHHSLCSSKKEIVLSSQRKSQDVRITEASLSLHATMATTSQSADTTTTLAREDTQTRKHLREIFLKAVQAGMPRQMLERVCADIDRVRLHKYTSYYYW